MKIEIEITDKQLKCSHAFPVSDRTCRKCGLDNQVYIWYVIQKEKERGDE